jgi:hypothetical protein
MANVFLTAVVVVNRPHPAPFTQRIGKAFLDVEPVFERIFPEVLFLSSRSSSVPFFMPLTIFIAALLLREFLAP